MTLKPKLYLETTIPSYLVARSSRDLIITAHQQITQEWWKRRRAHFEIFISEVVAVCAHQGFRCPVICTPDELLEGVAHV